MNEVPHLACVVTYEMPIAAAGDAPRPEAMGARSPAPVLAEGERLLYDALREWRSKTAREEGVPPLSWNAERGTRNAELRISRSPFRIPRSAFADWLLDATARWPKNARFTLTQRIENHALDVFENLVECRYVAARRRDGLAQMNLTLERMRYLFRRAKALGP